MTEILTESFCERCGTRYTFESAAPRKSRIGRVRTMSRGLRNFVMQDDLPLSEAMADARSEDERSATAHQLDAFHKTFNFCLTCRQYTCGNCWNTADGRCLSCAPVPGLELPGPATTPEPPPLPERPEPVGVEAWPEADLPTAWPDADLPAARPAPSGAPAAAEVADATADEVTEPEPASGILGLAPGQRLEDAVAALEAQLDAEAEVEAEVVEPEAVAFAAPEPEVEVEPEPEPVAFAAPEPEVEAEVVEPEPEPEILEPPQDLVPQPTWPPTPPPAPVVAPLPAPAQAPGQPPASPWLTVAPEDESVQEPQWPVAASWGRTSRAGAPATIAGRQLIPRDDAAALWAASAREVLSGSPTTTPLPATAPAPATPQPCVSCGLSLSANARFCRRCGSRQG